MSPIIVSSDPTGRTFLDLQDESLGDDFSPTKYRALVKRWLNEGERRIFRRARVAEGESTFPISTVAGTAALALELDVVRLNSLRNTTDREPLEEWSIEDLDAAPAATGKPYAFAIVGNEADLYPTPDGVYELEGRIQARPGEMVEDGDVPQLHQDYVHLLVTYARARLFRAEDDAQMTTLYMNEFELEIPRLQADVGRRSRTRRRRVPGMFATGSSRPTFARPS